MTYSSSLSGAVSNYSNIRTIPAFVSAAFIALSLYQFGGIDPVTFNWGLNYTFEPAHAALGSLAAYLVAFMSSETKDFQYYENWEKGAIVAGPSLIFLWHYVPEVETEILNAMGDPLGAQVAFLLGVVSWVVIVR